MASWLLNATEQDYRYDEDPYMETVRCSYLNPHTWSAFSNTCIEKNPGKTVRTVSAVQIQRTTCIIHVCTSLSPDIFVVALLKMINVICKFREIWGSKLD
jgi:hypothetical protein